MSTYFVVFGTFVAANSALDAFRPATGGAIVAGGVASTSARMPLVRPPVTGPTKDSYPAAGVTRPALRATR